MPQNYYELYFPLLLQVLVGMAMGLGLVGGSFLFGQRIKNKVKDQPYECGMEPVGSARERFSVKFYLVAMIFILFDIEAIFLYPWVVVYRDFVSSGSGMLIFWEMFAFVVLVLCGFYYIWKKGVLDWTVEQPKKMESGSEEVIRKYAA
jgi:NADH-quinone oxidoreductase subunit A